MKHLPPDKVVEKLVGDFSARKEVFQNRINVEDWAPTNTFWIWGVYN